MKGKGKPII